MPNAPPLVLLLDDCLCYVSLMFCGPVDPAPTAGIEAIVRLHDEPEIEMGRRGGPISRSHDRLEEFVHKGAQRGACPVTRVLVASSVCGSSTIFWADIFIPLRRSWTETFSAPMRKR
jgi:hypothetical protein